MEFSKGLGLVRSTARSGAGGACSGRYTHRYNTVFNNFQ